MTFSPANRPKALSDVLREAWLSAKDLRGRPDILRISRHLAAASPGLIDEMARTGVQVEIASPKEKSLPGSLRSAQEASRCLLMAYQGEQTEFIAESAQLLCKLARDSRRCIVGGQGQKVEDAIQKWLSLAPREPESLTTKTAMLDWKPGKWMSSWEVSLPPSQPRHFNGNGFYGSCIWLQSGEKAEREDFWSSKDYDNVPEIAKDLVACWPSKTLEVARHIGVTLKELQWFFSGKAPLERHARYHLQDLLGIEYNESLGMYAESESRAYVLVARKPVALKNAYESITCGGDAQTYEIIPRQGAADPSWRYVLINKYDGSTSILMAPRGEKITDRLPELIMNYEGIKSVDPEFYQDVVSTSASSCSEPDAYIGDMIRFAARNYEYLEHCRRSEYGL